MAFNNYSENDLFFLGMLITGGKSQFGGKSNKLYNSSNITPSQSSPSSPSKSSLSQSSTSNQNIIETEQLHPVNVNMTDREFYMLVSGMIVGLRIGKKQNRKQHTSKPINIGTPATIGISVASEQYEEDKTEYKIPVYTHSVNIGYNGFTALIKYDNNLLNLIRIEEAEFGSIQTTRTNNTIYAKGLNENVEFNREVVLFYLIFSTKQVLTKDTPAHINIISSQSDTDQSKTTLLTYTKDESTGETGLYYITPLTNTSGEITSNLSKSTATIGEKEEIKTKASPSGIYLTTSFTSPGRVGYISVITSGNKEQANLYKSFKVNIEVNNTNDSIEILSVKAMDGWDISYTINKQSEDVYIVNIEGTRGKADSDTCTACYIEFKANVKINQLEYNVPFYNKYSELINDEQIYNNINRKDGLAYYSEQITPSEACGKTSSNCSSVTVSGNIYSPVDQTIWLKFNSSPPIPVFIPASTPQNPTYILVDIPIIKSEDEGTEGTLEITTEKGYILIPAGFEIIVNNSDLADKLFTNITRICKESVSVSDGYIMRIEDTKTGDIFIVAYQTFKLKDKIKYRVETSNKLIIAGKQSIDLFNGQKIKLVQSTPSKHKQSNSIKASFGIKIRLE